MIGNLLLALIASGVITIATDAAGAAVTIGANMSACSTTAQNAALYLTQLAALQTYQTILRFGNPRVGGVCPLSGSTVAGLVAGTCILLSLANSEVTIGLDQTASYTMGSLQVNGQVSSSALVVSGAASVGNGLVVASGGCNISGGLVVA